jgi:hemolysin activation/secretion protein
LCAALFVILVGSGAWAQTPKPADGPRFDIWVFHVVGNTLLSAAQVEAAVYPFLGPGKQLADVEGARTALEKAYQDRGFLSVVVDIPQQRVAGGEVRLEVTQATVDRLRITGSRYHLPSRIRAEAPSVAPGKVPDFNALQADIARIQQASPDLRITPLITQAEAPGKIVVELKVEDEAPLHGSAELNTKQSFNTLRGRLEAGIRYDNLFQSGHSLGVNWFVSPRKPSQANTIVGSYALPWRSSVEGRSDDRLSAVWVHSNSNTPTSLGGATVVKGDTVGLRWRMPLSARIDSAANAWTLGADYKRNRDASQDVAGFSTDNPELRYPVLVLGYDFYTASAEGSQFSGDATLTIGTTATGSRTVNCNGTTREQFDCKRVGASPSFRTLRLGGAWRQPVGAGWSGSLRLQGQLSSQPLVSGEQFGAGGVDSVRGYYEFEQVGDLGLAGQLEVSTPNWAPWSGVSISGLAFLDRAWLRVLDALPSEQSSIRMGSYGLGLRAQTSFGMQLRLDFAVPQVATLKADSSGQLVPVSGKATQNERRWDLSIKQSF